MIYNRTLPMATLISAARTSGGARESPWWTFGRVRHKQREPLFIVRAATLDLIAKKWIVRTINRSPLINMDGWIAGKSVRNFRARSRRFPILNVNWKRLSRCLWGKFPPSVVIITGILLIAKFSSIWQVFGPGARFSSFHFHRVFMQQLGEPFA